MEDWRSILARRDAERKAREASLPSTPRAKTKQELEDEQYVIKRQLAIDLSQATDSWGILEYVRRDVWHGGMILPNEERLRNGAKYELRLEKDYIEERPEFVQTGYEEYPNPHGPQLDPFTRPTFRPTGKTIYSRKTAFLAISFQMYYRPAYTYQSIAEIMLFSSAEHPRDVYSFNTYIHGTSQRQDFSTEEYLAQADKIKEALQIRVAEDCQVRTEKGLIP